MNKNLKTIILIGPPGSGKSFWAHNYLAKNPRTVIVNRDSFRFMLRNTPVVEAKIESLINILQEQTILNALDAKLDVIVDNTNLKARYINDIIELVRYKADVEYVVLDVSLKKCLERDAQREKTVGEDVVRRMYKDYEILKDSFVFQPVKRKHKIHDYSNKSGLPEIVVFDIDATLAHSNGKRNPYDWENVLVDDEDDVVVSIYRMHMAHHDRIWLLTGRDGVAKEQTEEWFRRRSLVYERLLMKGVNDKRRDTVVKRELYEREIAGKYFVRLIYEDRPRIVEMWRKMGLKVFHVEPGI